MIMGAKHSREADPRGPEPGELSASESKNDGLEGLRGSAQQRAYEQLGEAHEGTTGQPSISGSDAQAPKKRLPPFLSVTFPPEGMTTSQHQTLHTTNHPTELGMTVMERIISGVEMERPHEDQYQFQCQGPGVRVYASGPLPSLHLENQTEDKRGGVRVKLTAPTPTMAKEYFYGAAPTTKVEWEGSLLFKPASRLERRRMLPACLHLNAEDERPGKIPRRQTIPDGPKPVSHGRELAMLLLSHPSQQQQGTETQELVRVHGLSGRKSRSCPYLSDLTLEPMQMPAAEREDRFMQVSMAERSHSYGPKYSEKLRELWSDKSKRSLTPQSPLDVLVSSPTSADPSTHSGSGQASDRTIDSDTTSCSGRENHNWEAELPTGAPKEDDQQLKEDDQQTIDLSKRTSRDRQLQLSDKLGVCYGFVCQSGCHPAAQAGLGPGYLAHAAESGQDFCMVQEAFAGDKDQLLLGAFDGHGKIGDRISREVALLVPELLAKEMASDPLSVSMFKRVFGSAHEIITEEMGAGANLSGTTAIAAVVSSNAVKFAHVGNTRLIIGKRHGLSGSLVPVVLTKDHTLYNKAECSRILEACPNAVIATQNAKDGGKTAGVNPWRSNSGGTSAGVQQWRSRRSSSGGGPSESTDDLLRVYLQDLDYPGLHITRSIGDTIAKQVGVIAEPEVQSYELSSNDQLIVILSEGVHTRMSSQEVLDIAVRYKNPHQAASQVVKKACASWLAGSSGVKVDDMTVVIARLKWAGQNT